MALLSEEIAAYEAMRDTLEVDYLGKWITLHDGILIGTYETFEEAAKEAVQQFGRGPYLIRQVGAPPAVLPTSLLYR